ncbi:hypothetical protein [Pseudomonas sp. RSP]|jgi:hypothetical protein
MFRQQGTLPFAYGQVRLRLCQRLRTMPMALFQSKMVLAPMPN